MDIVDRAIRNWKLHVLALVLTIIAELIGAKTFKVGPGILVLVPLLYSFALGALCGLPKLKILKREDMFEASSLVGVTFFFLMARYGTLVGPSFWKVVESGPALILQEFGNLGTVFFGVPIARPPRPQARGCRARRSQTRASLTSPSSAKNTASTRRKDAASWASTSPAPSSAAVFCSLLSSFVASTIPFFSPQASRYGDRNGKRGRMMTAGARSAC